jgi:hypothetical protein
MIEKCSVTPACRKWSLTPAGAQVSFVVMGLEVVLHGKDSRFALRSLAGKEGSPSRSDRVSTI